MLRAFGILRGDVVAVVGAGGKTTLVYRLASEARAAGLTVLVTTTTHMGALDDEVTGPVLVDGESADTLVALGEALAGEGRATLLGRRLRPDKLEGIAPARVDVLAPLADLVLVEADGARGRSLKVPAPHEPVIPASTTLVVVVCALDALGQPLDEDRVHRTSLVRAGAWAHLPAPDRLPSWIGQGGFADVIAHRGATIVGINGDAAVPAGSEPVELVVRAVAQSRSHDWSVIADVPLDETIWSSIEDSTGITMLSLGDTRDGALASAAAAAGATAAAIPSSWIRKVVTRGGGKWVLEPYIFVRFQDWASRSTGLVKVYIRIAPDEMYRRIAAAQGSSSQNQNMAQATIVVLGLIGILFIIIEGAALAMGWALARSITRSVHALFTGTERLRLGDLGHRIPIWSRDQLGELAESFNAMTANLETLLEQQAEKRRLEEELRIAREIQMSLLPRQAPPIAGLSLAAFCEPAREVGGDYYDFFVLGPGRLGMLVADVAGKGTSAALYMAELKGLMLSLSQIHESPRTLLVEVNRIIAHNLDSRSFITMTYAVVDVPKRTLTYARAGHTPLIHRTTASPPVATLIAPNGMVVGLQLDGLEHKFEELLEEETLPLVDGDVFVLYTDGVSEAMSGDGELYGEERLRSLVEEHGGLGSDGLRERIARDVELHVAGADRHDDMTMIVVTVERTAGA